MATAKQPKKAPPKKGRPMPRPTHRPGEGLDKTTESVVHNRVRRKPGTPRAPG